MKFVKLMDKIHDLGLEWDLPACCDPEKSSYSLLRAQMSGSILFCPEEVRLGVEHDEKCRALLKLARQRNHDLVLLPEYCSPMICLEKSRKIPIYGLQTGSFGSSPAREFQMNFLAHF